MNCETVPYTPPTDPTKVEMSTPPLEPFPAHWQESILNLYKSWGVGDTANRRHNFWKMYMPDTYISHFTTDEDLVRCFEFHYCTNAFPQDIDEH